MIEPFKRISGDNILFFKMSLQIWNPDCPQSGTQGAKLIHSSWDSTWQYFLSCQSQQH